MIIKLNYTDIIEVAQISSYHQEGKYGEEGFYMEINYPANGEQEITISVDNICAEDPNCIMDCNWKEIEEGHKVHMGIYTDAMVEIVTIFKNF